MKDPTPFARFAHAVCDDALTDGAPTCIRVSCFCCKPGMRRATSRRQLRSRQNSDRRWHHAKFFGLPEIFPPGWRPAVALMGPVGNRRSPAQDAVTAAAKRSSTSGWTEPGFAPMFAASSVVST